MSSRSDRRDDQKIFDLFVRYWDNTLTSAEAVDMERRLASSAADRQLFRDLSLQATTAAETSVLTRAEPGKSLIESNRGPWSRRRILRYLAGGLALGAAGGFAGRWFGSRAAAPMRLTAARGTVNVVSATGEAVDPGESVPPGATVTTQGPQSSARLCFPEGTLITLANDSILTLTDSPRHLLLRQGSATADTRARPVDDNLMVLGTNGATLTKLSAAVTMVGYTTEGATEVGVVQGRVTVSAPTGGTLGVVYEGEMLTVQKDGSQLRQPLPTAPDAFSWDLAQPLPDGWMVGAREESAEGPVVRPRSWFDRYHRATMSQIRSNKQWTRGFFQLMPDSVFRVRYWVERPGPSQLCVCVRTIHSSSPDTGMLECNDAFLSAKPKQWQWLEVRAGDMLDNKHVPEFGPPWVGFLVILNTYTEDLGLKIREFRVQPPA